MYTQVRTCPFCGRLMWVKAELVDQPDQNTIRYKCPHCQQTVQFKLVTQGSNAAGPKMGH